MKLKLIVLLMALATSALGQLYEFRTIGVSFTNQASWCTNVFIEVTGQTTVVPNGITNVVVDLQGGCNATVLTNGVSIVIHP